MEERKRTLVAKLGLDFLGRVMAGHRFPMAVSIGRLLIQVGLNPTEVERVYSESLATVAVVAVAPDDHVPLGLGRPIDEFTSPNLSVVNWEVALVSLSLLERLRC